jgi:hypothetical protein
MLLPKILSILNRRFTLQPVLLQMLYWRPIFKWVSEPAILTTSLAISIYRLDLPMAIMLSCQPEEMFFIQAADQIL